MKKISVLQYFIKISKIYKINSNIWVKKRIIVDIIVNTKRQTHKFIVKFTKMKWED